MVKSKHAPKRRVVLPNGMWLLIYEDGETIKIAGYDRNIEVTEALNREGGAHVIMRVTLTSDEPRTTSPRRGDLVTEEREVVSILDSRVAR